MTIWKCSFSWSGRSTIRTAGLLVDQADQPDRAAGDGVGDEQLLAVDDVIVAVEHGGVSQRGQVGPGAGSVRAKAESRRPLARRGKYRCFLLGAAEAFASGSTAPMQPWTDARPATVGSIVAIRVRNRENAANGPPVRHNWGSIEKSPVAGRAEFVQNRLGHLPVGVEQRAAALRCRRTTASDSSHGSIACRRWLGRPRQKQFDRDIVVPDRPMDRAVRRLIAGGEQGST